MMKRVANFLIGVLICYACGNADKANDDSIAGTYVREYSSEILNQLSGNKVGVRTIRDTLYITSAGRQYKVDNSKWSLNDYDNDGWQNMEHGESGPIPSFIATYDQTTHTLNSESAPDLIVSEDGISVGGKSEVTYAKMN